MKRHHLRKIIKESVKEVLNEQFDPCGESLWMTIFLDGGAQLGNITGYFPYTVDEVYEYLTTGNTGNTGTGYYIVGPALCNGNYNIPNACLGMQMNTEESEAELEDGTIITLPGVNNLSDVLANIIPTAGGAFTQNEDGTLEGPLELITNYSIYSQLFDQFDATVCWTTTEGANPPQCISNSDLLSFMYECGDNEIIWGCTDETADNYNPEATSDDGSCGYSGCTMFFATNYEDNFYDPMYVIDDGSCVFENYGCIEEYQNSTWIGNSSPNAWNEGLWLNGFGGYYDDNPVQTNPMYPGSEQYTTTSGCGPITGGGIYTAGNFMSFFLGQNQSGGQNVEGITIYNSMAECESHCGGGDDLCDNVPEGCCDKCYSNPTMPPDDFCYPYCECCDDPVSPILTYKCVASPTGSNCVSTEWTQGMIMQSLEQCEQSCGSDDPSGLTCKDVAQLTPSELTILNCGCNQDTCNATITLPPILLPLCDCPEIQGTTVSPEAPELTSKTKTRLQKLANIKPKK